MDLDVNFFANLNGLTYKISYTDFYNILNQLNTSLSSGEPISTNTNPTPDQLTGKLDKISTEVSEKMSELRTAAGELMSIYETVTKTTIGVIPGSGTRGGLMAFKE